MRKMPFSLTETLRTLVSLMIALLAVVAFPVAMALNQTPDSPPVSIPRNTMIQGSYHSTPSPMTKPEPTQTEYTVKVTHYCPCIICCGKWSVDAHRGDSSFQQLTRSGDTPENVDGHVTVSIDPHFFRPDLTTAQFFKLPKELREFSILLPGHTTPTTGFFMEDTGNKVTGAHIDVFVNHHNTTLKLGVYSTKIYINPQLLTYKES